MWHIVTLVLLRRPRRWLDYARPHNPPQTPLGKRLFEARPSSCAGPRDRAHGSPGPRIARPRDRGRLPLGPDGRGGFAVHVPFAERRRSGCPHLALLEEIGRASCRERV